MWPTKIAANWANCCTAAIVDIRFPVRILARERPNHGPPVRRPYVCPCEVLAPAIPTTRRHLIRPRSTASRVKSRRMKSSLPVREDIATGRDCSSPTSRPTRRLLRWPTRPNSAKSSNNERPTGWAGKGRRFWFRSGIGALEIESMRKRNFAPPALSYLSIPQNDATVGRGGGQNRTERRHTHGVHTVDVSFQRTGHRLCTGCGRRFFAFGKLFVRVRTPHPHLMWRILEKG